MTREEAEKTIKSLYGVEPRDSAEGVNSVMALMAYMGLDALSDEGVVKLAEMQMRVAGV